MSFAFFFVFFTLHYTVTTSTPLPFELDSAQSLVNGDRNPLSCSANCNQRSIQDIIWGCLGTIFACARLAVHPNMPATDAKWWRVGIIRLELMAWTIISPELVIYWAVRQWIGAHRVQKSYKDKNWTISHGYFIQMGGFMLFDGNVRKGVLSARRFHSLLNRREILFPEVTEEEIQDRSKGDWLSKSLVIAQTTWFIAQFLGRIVQGLTASELELVTLAFAALNGFMYFFWWNKPLDVRTPIAIRLLNPTRQSDDLLNAHRIAPTGAGVLVDKPCECDNEPVMGINISWSLLKTFNSFTSALEVIASERLQLFSAKPDNLLLGKMRMPIFFASEISGKVDRLITMPVAIVIFGAIHCIGWNFAFPSAIEERLWRISSLIVLGGPTLLLLLLILESIISDVLRMDNNKYIYMAHHSRAVKIAVVLLLCVAASIYVLARFFLVVEAFAALRNLPLSTKSVVNWTSFLPHV